ncbi:MAG: zf-HC2 domain-containing protein [Candidatus Zixiibacteriota bacterium]|jgi:anti-sigma factor RsiW
MATTNKNKKTQCPNWQILLGEYALGIIEERDRVRLERHLKQCRRCRNALAKTQKMYALLGEFEPAGPEASFAATLDETLREEVGIGWVETPVEATPEPEAVAPVETAPEITRRPEAEPRREKARGWIWDWLRKPAFVSVAAAATLAVVATVLYVEVWLPNASAPSLTPAPGKMAPATGTVAARDTGGTAREETEAVSPAEGVREAALPDEPVGDLATPSPALERKKPAGRGPGFGAAGRATASEPMESGYDDFDKLMAEEIAAADEATGGMSFMGGRGAGGRVRGMEEMTALTVTAGAGATPGRSRLEGKIYATADVESYMDVRFETDVSRLTAAEGAALVDYVTPNGSLMAYFYELPVEEQETLLSRLRYEAEEAAKAETEAEAGSASYSH